MKGIVFIDDIAIGQIDLKIIDESMGVLGGEMEPFEAYNKFKSQIQQNCETKGISNLTDFNYKIMSAGKEINNIGGIGITHSKDFDDEISVEICGVDISK